MPERVGRDLHSNNGYAPNRYYTPEHVNPTGGTVALAANTLYAIPFRVRERTTFTRLGVEVTTGAGANGRLGIYNAANGVPTALVVDAGNVIFSSTGEKEVTISQTLMPGLYFIGVVTDNTPTLLGGTIQHTAMIADVGLLSPDAQGSGGTMRISGSHTFGALPTNFPTVVRDDITTIILPWMRVV